MNKGYKYLTMVIFTIFCMIFYPGSTLHTVASENGTTTAVDGEEVQNRMQEKMIGELGLDDVTSSLQDMFPGEKMNFKETVLSIIQGDVEKPLSTMKDLVIDQLFYELKYNQKNLIHILLLAVIAAIFTNFAKVFQNKQISEISFYILYLLLLTLCLDSFRVVSSSVGVNLERLLTFMSALSPAYFLAVGISTGPTSAVAFYNIILLVIFIMEVVIANFLLPMIHIYVMVEVLNYLSLEESLSKLGELLKLMISWTLKSLLALVIGFNVIQGLLSPVIDTLKRSMVTKTAEAVPVVGDMIGGLSEVILGTTVLVKNGIGIAGAIICIVICLHPLIQMAFMVLVYKLVAAVIQPISDKRIVNCIASIGEGYQLLLKVIFTTGILFLITIAVVTASTS
ncbi:stage III sporulation protein AE [Lachnospiraceae bacterium LCP25S3_G4]